MEVALDGLTNAFLCSWLKDPDRRPYQNNIQIINKMFLKGVLAE